MALPPHLASLLRPEAYPHAVGALQLVETHLSWIVLTGEYAYKLKRPVHFPFADFRDSAHRAALCAEELRLNRRFAPQLYLDVVEIRRRDGLAWIGGSGEVLEHAVRMRQFDRRDELDALVLGGRVEAEELERLGARLAQLHGTLAPASADSPHLAAAREAITLARNLTECRALPLEPQARARLEALAPSFEARRLGCRAWLERRVEAGWIRECHGDLHLSNIVRLGDELVPFDALEFEPAFRWIDPADEVAFLCADLEGYARDDLARSFLSAWLEAGGDYEALRVFDLYRAHRALVRAKIIAIRAATAATQCDAALAQQRERRYVEVAERALASHTPRLVLMHGLAGSGKSTIARRLATSRADAVLLRSDVERKRLAGLSALQRSASGLGEHLYAPAASDRTYAHLLQAAEHALASGRSALCDAAFLTRAQRAPFAALARRLGLVALIVECRAPRAELLRRIDERAQGASDASEADAAVLAWQEQRLEPIGADEGLQRVAGDALADDWDSPLLRASVSASP